MAKEKPVSQDQPPRVWLPKTILTFLVFAALVFVIYGTMFGMGERQLSTGNAWALIVALAMLLLLPVVDRIEEISLSPTGFKAKMTQVQAEAIKEVGARVEDPQAAKAAQEQILQAKSPEQVQAAVAEAVRLNVTRTVDTLQDAIRKKKKCYVRYRPVPDEPVQSYYIAPLDIKPGKTAATKANDYLWAYSYEHESTVSLRLDRVVGAERSEESFDPEQVMLPGKQPEWNVTREW